MGDPTQVPVNPQVITKEELFRRKGELVTQLEMCQGQLQMVNQQLMQLLNTQPV